MHDHVRLPGNIKINYWNRCESTQTITQITQLSAFILEKLLFSLLSYLSAPLSFTKLSVGIAVCTTTWFLRSVMQPCSPLSLSILSIKICILKQLQMFITIIGKICKWSRFLVKVASKYPSPLYSYVTMIEKL